VQPQLLGRQQLTSVLANKASALRIRPLKVRQSTKTLPVQDLGHHRAVRSLQPSTAPCTAFVSCATFIVVGHNRLARQLLLQRTRAAWPLRPPARGPNFMLHDTAQPSRLLESYLRTCSSAFRMPHTSQSPPKSQMLSLEGAKLVHCLSTSDDRPPTSRLVDPGLPRL